MMELGNKIAKKRKDRGLTQSEFAEELNVTRQTVSRWEAGTVLPDIDKINDIATLLNVSCDYLLKDEVTEEQQPADTAISRLLKETQGKKIRIHFYEDENDIDLFDKECVIEEFSGNWMKVSCETPKGHLDKLIPVSCVLSIELVKENG